MYKKPIMPIHHLEAHLTIAGLDQPDLQYPYIGLLVSGGHTAIILAKGLGDYEVLGETLDDAAGEAFDKGAKILGLGYPGGPEIAKAAAAASPDVPCPVLPIPMQRKKDLDFSFSGLKTAFNQKWQAEPHKEAMRGCYAKALEATIAQALLTKVAQAMTLHPGLDWVVAGGVAANRVLRAQLDALAVKRDCRIIYPPLSLCTDNAAMVAYTAYQYIKAGKKMRECEKDVLPRWPLESL